MQSNYSSLLLILSLAGSVRADFQLETQDQQHPAKGSAIARFGSISLPAGTVSCELSANGKYYFCRITGDRKRENGDRSAEVREVETGRICLRLNGLDWTYSVAHAFSDNGLIAVSCSDGQIGVWDFMANKEILRVRSELKQLPMGIALTSAGRYLFFGGAMEYRIWDVTTGKEIHKIRHQHHVTHAVAVPGTDYFLVGDDSGAAFVLDARKGTRNLEMQLFASRGQEPAFGYTMHSIYRLVSSPNGETLACQSFDGEQVIYSLRRKKELLRSKDSERRALAFTFAPDSTHFLTFGVDGVIRRWDTTTAKELEPLIPRIEHSLSPAAFAFAPDGKKIITITKVLRTWDAETGKELSTTDTHRDRLTSMAACPKGSWVATGSADGTIRLWNPKTGERLATLDDKSPAVVALATWGDGKRLAAGSNDGNVRIWEDNKVIAKIDAHPNSLTDIAASADGRILMTAGIDSTVRFWNLATFKLERIVATSAIPRQVAISANGTVAASLDANWQVSMWDVASGKAEALPEPLKQTRGIALSPSGHLLVTSDGVKVRLVDTASRRCLHEFTLHVSLSLERLAFLTDRTIVATGRNRASVFDLIRGNCENYHSFPSEVGGMAVVLGQTKLYTGHADTLGYGWDLSEWVKESAKPGPPELLGLVLGGVWRSLASENATSVRGAINALLNQKDVVESVVYLKSSLKPVAVVDDAVITADLKLLDSDDFDTRELAFKRLLAQEDAILPHLRKRLADAPGADLKGKLEDLIAKAEEITPERLRVIRVVLVLEVLDTPAARELLAECASGAASARLTQAAKAALQRMKDRPAP